MRARMKERRTGMGKEKGKSADESRPGIERCRGYSDWDEPGGIGMRDVHTNTKE
jgi:hypothetical protein